MSTRSGEGVAIVALALMVLSGCVGNTRTRFAFCEERWHCQCKNESEYCELCVSVEVDVVPPTHGQFCTNRCTRDSQCGETAACIRWEGDDEGFCYQRCHATEDCYPSSRCAEVFVEERELQICLPDRLPDAAD